MTCSSRLQIIGSADNNTQIKSNYLKKINIRGQIILDKFFLNYINQRNHDN